MSRRMRSSLCLVVIALSVAALFCLDWPSPIKWYHGYQQIKALTEHQDTYDEALAAVKKQFGESAGFDVTINVDGSGNISRAVRATRECGDIDESSFLAQVIGLLRQSGMPWPDKIEYRFRCGFSKPQSLGAMVPTLSKSIVEQFKTNQICADVQPGTLSRITDYWYQSWCAPEGAVDTRFYVGKTGDAERVQVLAWPQLMNPDVQHHLILCTANALIGILAPASKPGMFDDKFRRVWQSGNTAATSIRIDDYQVDTRARPLELNLYPVRQAMPAH